MKLIVGLGNPGNEYLQTRHNAGFLVVDALAQVQGAVWKTDTKLHAEITKIKTSFFLGETVLLAKPQTYMNLSGEVVQSIASYYKIAPIDILIVQDDMDLMPGALSFIAKGGPAGHNGIISIQTSMARTDIARLRIGIGRPTPPTPKEDWVLGKMDKQTISIIVKAVEAGKDWATQGLEKAMNNWNRKL